MRVVSRRLLRDFWEIPGRRDSQIPLKTWYDVVQDATWTSHDDVKATYGANVDFAHGKYIFDIGGNKYRLICVIDFARHGVLTLRVCTHAEYDVCALIGESGFNNSERVYAMNTVRPLHTRADYESAIAEVRRLWGSEAGTADGDRLDLLMVLVGAYEDEHDAIDPPDPIEAILRRMDDLGMSRADLGAMIGASSGRVSEILNRRRHLTLDMIRKLVIGLGLSEHCLLQPYEIERRQHA